MRAGWLRQRVELQSATRTVDAVGEPVATWATYAAVWASVEPQRAREVVSQAAEQGRQLWTVRLRWRPDVTRAHRVVYDGRVLEIESVSSPFERRREIELVCREAL